MVISGLLDIAGYIDAVVSLVGIAAFILGFYLWRRGIMLPVYRLGRGLARRKVYVLANENHARSLSDLLTDSGLFHSDNIIKITTHEDIGKAHGRSLYIVRWSDWSEKMSDILAMKQDSAFMVVYAPISEGHIPLEWMSKFGEYRNIAVSNMRGRLLGDVFLAMMTTSFTDGIFD